MDTYIEHTNFVSDPNLVVNIAKAGNRSILKNYKVFDFVAIKICVSSVSSNSKNIKTNQVTPSRCDICVNYASCLFHI